MKARGVGATVAVAAIVSRGIDIPLAPSAVPPPPPPPRMHSPEKSAHSPEARPHTTRPQVRSNRSTARQTYAPLRWPWQTRSGDGPDGKTDLL